MEERPFSLREKDRMRGRSDYSFVRFPLPEGEGGLSLFLLGTLDVIGKCVRFHGADDAEVALLLAVEAKE